MNILIKLHFIHNLNKTVYSQTSNYDEFYQPNKSNLIVARCCYLVEASYGE